MTGCPCYQRTIMMGPGGDGCCTEEKTCLPTSGVQVTTLAAQLAMKKPTSLGVDLFSQARKALSVRSPLDVPEDGSASASSVITLPSRLVSLLKPSDNRKRRKRSHSGADKKSSRAGERSHGANFWADKEVYFRDLALPDIDALDKVSSLSSLDSRKCFLIPHLGNGNGMVANVECIETTNVGNVNGVGTEENNQDPQSVEIDSVLAESLPKEDGKNFSAGHSAGSLEWILGSRNRILLASERPSKKRKLLGGDAGLEKILVGRPCMGNSSLCDFCCTGHMASEAKRLIVCSSCNVTVHHKCYGVEEVVNDSWLCSWCKCKGASSDSSNPCMLCPKQGGALKSVDKRVKNDGCVEFSHLFCSLWMPEVYVEDLTNMEPIMNLREIKETRRKLVCNICKVKCGTCVRCSHGACRTSFHPICAREARNRMEVWGRYGCDDVELRAFCSKHSDGLGSCSMAQEHSSISDGDVSGTTHLPLLSMNKLDSHGSGDNISVRGETCHSNDGDLAEFGLSDTILNTEIVSECADTQQAKNKAMSERRSGDDVKSFDSVNLAPILKKLIERGKVNVKEVASDIGIPPDSLSSGLADDSLAPQLRFKIAKWLRDHAYMGVLQKNLNFDVKFPLKDENGTVESPDGVTVAESDITVPVAIKSVPPRRRTNSNIRVLRNDRVISFYEEFLSENGKAVNELKVDRVVSEEQENSSERSTNTSEKSLSKTDGFHDSVASHSPKSEDISGELSNGNLYAYSKPEVAAVSQSEIQVNDNQGSLVCANGNAVVINLTKMGAASSCYIHPYISKKLQMHSELFLKSTNYEDEGRRDRMYDFDDPKQEGRSRLEESSHAIACCNRQNQCSECSDSIGKLDRAKLEEPAEARKVGVLELSPRDEVEGEIIYFQHRLLGNAVGRKSFTDGLIHKVAESISHEIDVAHSRSWDAALVSQYLCDLREAKKQGRKERKHKEAQAVLAAATAAAAASSRISSFRKDAFDESANQENLTKLNNSSGRSGTSSQLMPRPKETLSRVAVPRISTEKYFDYVQSVSDFSREHSRSCDICRRSETMLNPILMCSSCKVAVHLACYRSVKESTGPWFCELCEALLPSRCPGAPTVNFLEKPYFVAECGLCGGTTGAFRKSSDGQWVHALCAEWIFEPAFRRGQVNSVEGMETVTKGVGTCCICHHKHGVCITCNYGHCQTTFHPSCARSAGFYMNIKTTGGKLQHKAYCEKHSLEQRTKAETQKHGLEELRSIKQIRVELERLRLLCERIIRREKIKRELVFCSHDILAYKRDHVARSVLVRSPFFRPESSESATTSLKGHTDGYKSSSEAIQRSDDITVDSTLSFKNFIKVPVSMDTDQKTDDSSSFQNITRKAIERVPFSGKQIPHDKPPGSSLNSLDDGEWSSKSRKLQLIESFEKELVMTSDQACMKNQQLPKGYVYIPVDCLSKEEKVIQDDCSSEHVEHDG
ncbi:uncharacterized protein LOC120010818 isoform X1 [Tripterygium wilfordii]|uniref:uncharacterized protein LOC120010818 isoform X1 n=1 Tax=Tripterygium wilfordii TaxID=458696 RepID=UPI0018F7E978|nr:uncharacterized protein LOC120010818 isoform X1 [Tripterygium wilfordii]